MEASGIESKEPPQREVSFFRQRPKAQGADMADSGSEHAWTDMAESSCMNIFFDTQVVRTIQLRGLI